jgi:hypothetical protein
MTFAPLFLYNNIPIYNLKPYFSIPTQYCIKKGHEFNHDLLTLVTNQLNPLEREIL